VRSFRLFGKAFGISSQSPMRRPSRWSAWYQCHNLFRV
jgi:hypothetical protein